MATIKMYIPQDQLKKFNAALMMYTGGLKKEANRTMVQHARLLARDLVKWTPPQGGKSEGERAVERDINNAVALFNHKDTGDKELRKRLKDIETQRDYKALNAIFKNVPYFNNKKAVPFSPELHTSKRIHGNRLRVKESNFLTMDKEELKAYKQYVKDKVGKLKASWMPMLEKLNVSVASWVSRHSAYGNSVTKCNIKLGDSPSIVVWNGSRPISYLKHAADTALAGRAASMARDLAYKIKHMKNKIGQG